MGAQNWIMISDPTLCHGVLGKNGKSTSGRPYSTYGYEIYGRGGKEISFAGQSKEWKAARATCKLLKVKKKKKKKKNRYITTALNLQFSVGDNIPKKRYQVQ
jgi:hypothetical protein